MCKIDVLLCAKIFPEICPSLPKWHRGIIILWGNLKYTTLLIPLWAKIIVQLYGLIYGLSFKFPCGFAYCPKMQWNLKKILLTPNSPRLKNLKPSTDWVFFLKIDFFKGAVLLRLKSEENYGELGFKFVPGRKLGFKFLKKIFPNWNSRQPWAISQYIFLLIRYMKGRANSSCW